MNPSYLKEFKRKAEIQKIKKKQKSVEIQEAKPKS